MKLWFSFITPKIRESPWNTGMKIHFVSETIFGDRNDIVHKQYAPYVTAINGPCYCGRHNASFIDAVVPSQSKQVFFCIGFSIRKFFTSEMKEYFKFRGWIRNLTSIFIIYDLSASLWAIKHYPNLHNKHLMAL